MLSFPSSVPSFRNWASPAAAIDNQKPKVNGQKKDFSFETEQPKSEKAAQMKLDGLMRSVKIWPDLFFWRIRGLHSSFNGKGGVPIHYTIFRHHFSRGTFVLCHGAFENRSHYLSMAKELFKLRYNICLFDQRGFGRSHALEASRREVVDIQHPEDMVDDLGQILSIVHDKLGDKPITLVGNSMGGAVIARYLQEYGETKDCVKAVVLTAPMLGFYNRYGLKSLGRWIAKKAQDWHLDHYLLPGLQPGSKKSMWDFYHQLPEAAKIPFLRNAKIAENLDLTQQSSATIRTVNQAFSFTDSIMDEENLEKSRKLPTLIISGERDKSVDQEAHMKYLSSLQHPLSRQEVIAKSHFLIQEIAGEGRLDRFAQELSEFSEKVSLDQERKENEVRHGG